MPATASFVVILVNASKVSEKKKEQGLSKLVVILLLVKNCF